MAYTAITAKVESQLFPRQLDAALAEIDATALAAPNVAYAPGAFTVAAGYSRQIGRRLQLAGSQRATIEGNARLQVRN